MKTVSVKVDGRSVQMKLGRKVPQVPPQVSPLRRYLKGRLPEPPPSWDNGAKVPKWGALLNDQLGICVISAIGHNEQSWNFTAGRTLEIPDRELIQWYHDVGGYNPGDPNSDQGCFIPDAMNYWTRNRFAGTQPIMGYLSVNPKDWAMVLAAGWIFGGLYFGFQLSDSWLKNVQNGFVWDGGTPDPSAGHAVCGFGADSARVRLCTWGLTGFLTQRGAANCCDELYVMLTQDQLGEAQQKAPNGLDWSAIVADWNSLGGQVDPPGPPGPPPPNPPPPPPVPGTGQIVIQVPAMTLTGTISGGTQVAGKLPNVEAKAAGSYSPPPSHHGGGADEGQQPEPEPKRQPPEQHAAGGLRSFGRHAAPYRKAGQEPARPEPGQEGEDRGPEA